MSTSDPLSAGEPSAAPPDPWAIRRFDLFRAADFPRMEPLLLGDYALWRDVQAALATERQHHAEQLSGVIEAAEASLLALQQQIEAACESAMRLNVPIPQLVARLRDAAHLTGGPA